MKTADLDLHRKEGNRRNGSPYGPFIAIKSSRDGFGISAEDKKKRADT